MAVEIKAKTGIVWCWFRFNGEACTLTCAVNHFGSGGHDNTGQASPRPQF